MRIEFNKTGSERKELVKAISEITGAEAVYKFMPTCAYEIDYFTVTKDGALEFDDDRTSKLAPTSATEGLKTSDEDDYSGIDFDFIGG